MAVEPSAQPLTVSGVSTFYGKRKALQDVSFDVRPGEVFGLVGLNGAGKTTLIRSILGLRAASGAIRVFGEDTATPSARRHLIYLPEKFQPSGELSGWEYLSVLLAYFNQKLDKERARTFARRLDLDPGAIDRRIRTYSKGMSQKLGLVGTFLVDTPLMILDEPMSGLDPLARARLKDSLMERRANTQSVFFSSHILADIEEICGRIGILHRGRIIFLGPPSDLLRQFNVPTLERAFLAALEQHRADP